MAEASITGTKSLFFSDRIESAMTRIFDFPLTVVEAPMGYGKTTAVRTYLEGGKATLLWQSLSDGNGNAFWNNFCNFFSELDAECAQSLLSLGIPNDGISMQEALRLIGALKFNKRTVVVLDDYYMIDQEAVHLFIDSLVRNEFKNLHIVITTRLALLVNIEELKLKGYAQHVTKDSLELSAGEIQLYFQSCGIALNSLDADRLYAYTEGWISALYLYLLDSVKSQNDNPQNAVLEMRGSFDIYSLVRSAVYRPLSEELQEFLLTLCLFDSFTAEQAAFLWKGDNSRKLLDTLVSRNVFVTYDRRRRTYEMHNILSNFLKDVFEHREKEYKLSAYHRASEWNLVVGNHAKVMDFAYSAGDFEAIMKSIEFDKGHSMTRDDNQTIKRYIDESPLEVKARHPLALLVYAINMFMTNDMEFFESACSHFMEALHRNDALSETERNKLLGEFELLLSFTEYNDIVKMSQHHQNAWNLLNGPAEFLNTKECWTFGSPSVLYMFYREPSALEAAVNDLKELLPTYCRLTNGHGMGAEYIMEAELHLNRCNLQMAEIVAYKALSVSSSDEQSVIRVCAQFLLMRIALYKGEYAAVAEKLETLRSEAHQKKLYHLIYTIDMCEGFINAYSDKACEVPLWLRTGDFTSVRLFFPAIGFAHIVYGRTLIASGEYLKLLGICEQMLGVSSVFQNLLAWVYTTIYMAAANDRINHREQAMELLGKALDIVAPDGVLMPFVENCDFIKSLLEELLEKGHHQAMIHRILVQYAANNPTAGVEWKKQLPCRDSCLTKREMEIVALAIKGLSNREIGETLYISQNTVKTQMKSIFEKLSITSRVLLKQRMEKELQHIS